MLHCKLRERIALILPTLTQILPGEKNIAPREKIHRPLDRAKFIFDVVLTSSDRYFGPICSSKEMPVNYSDRPLAQV